MDSRQAVFELQVGSPVPGRISTMLSSVEYHEIKSSAVVKQTLDLMARSTRHCALNLDVKA